MTDKWTSFIRFSYLDWDTTNDQLFGDFGGNYLHPSNSNPGDGFGNTYSGTATGVRYTAEYLSLIQTNGAGASGLPGSSAGSTASGGVYA